MTRARDVASQGGLVLISSTTIGSAVTSVVVNNAFSSTYDNYEIIISGGVGTAGAAISMQLGATTTGYYKAGTVIAYGSASVVGTVASNASSFTGIGTLNTNSLSGKITLFDPNLAKVTKLISGYQFTGSTGDTCWQQGFLDNATQYTAFTITAANGTITGGTISVYGYKK